MKVHVRDDVPRSRACAVSPLSPCLMIWIGAIDAITLESKPPCSSHLLSAPPPLPPVYLDVEHTLSAGAAMVMRRLVPLVRTSFVGQHPVRMKQSWLNCCVPNKHVGISGVFEETPFWGSNGCQPWRGRLT